MADWESGLEILPRHMQDAVKRYIEYGIEGGSFLNAVMSNEFTETIGRADAINLQYLQKWAEYIYWYAPYECHGSWKKVEAWIARGGLKGREVQLTESEDNGSEESL